MIHAEITVTGHVQGVGYRYFTIREAQKRSIKGWVRNLVNGSVYCVAEGEDGMINDFIRMLKIGPMMSRVSGVDVKTGGDLKNFQTFEARF